MPSSDRTFTLEDLADALLAEHRYKDAAPALRDHHAARGKAFRRAFGVAELRAGNTSNRKRALAQLLETTLTSCLSFSSPTSGYLEAPRELVEFAERFTPDIARASAELDRVLRVMLLALLEELVAQGRTTVTERQLVEQGFDPGVEAPDADEFW